MSRRLTQAAPGPPEPETWDSIEQAAQHLYRGNPYPGIHYYRWVASHTLRQRAGRRARLALASERQGAALPRSDVDWWALLRTHPPLPPSCCAARRAPCSTATSPRRMAQELPERPLRRDPARRPHAARGQPRGRARGAPRLPRLLSCMCGDRARPHVAHVLLAAPATALRRLGKPGAPPLLLIHGGRDHCRNWDWTAAALRETGT